MGPSISGLKFQVRVGAPQTTRFFISDLGHVGVNTVTPQSNFVVSNDAGTQSIELNQLTSVSRIFAYNRAAGTFLPLALNDGGGVVLIGTVANNGSLLQAHGEATFGSGTEKLSVSTQSLGFNRRVSTGVIYDTNAFAYQFQHTQSTTSTSDYLALQVYNTGGGSVTVSAWAVNGVGNVLIGTPSDNASGARLQVNGAATFSSSVTATQLYLGSLTNEQLMISGTGSRGIGVSTITSGDPYVRLYDNTTIRADIWWGRSGSYMGINSLGAGSITAINPFGGNVLIGTTTNPTPVSGVSFPLTLSSSAATRLRIDSTNASPNSGVGLYANGVQKFSFAMYGATSDFTIYNDALLAPSVTVKGTNSNVLIGTTDDNGSKLRVAGGIGFFDSGIKTGTLDTGYVAGTWKLGRAVTGTQPSETHQIIVEINGALFVIGAAQL